MKTKIAQFGDRFGRYRCISVSATLKAEGLYQEFECDCGERKLLKTSRLRWEASNGKVPQCIKCSRKRRFSTDNQLQSAFQKRRSRVAIGLLSGTFFQHIKCAAIYRKLEFSLTIEYLWNLFEEQKGLCAYSKVPITLSLERKNKGPNFDLITASLDRKDNSKGYIEGNVQWVHKRINQMKSDDTEEQFIQWCYLVYLKSQVNR